MKRFSPKKILMLAALLTLGIFAGLFGSGLALNTSDSLTLNANAVTNNDTLYNREYIPIESVNLSTDSDLALKPGQRVELKVILTPQWAIKTVQNISYQLTSGSIYVDIEGDIMTAHQTAPVGAVIKVVATADGVRSNTLTFTVGQIPVESLTITNTQETITQSASLKINTALLPENATYNTIVYSIIEGGQYATVSIDGTVRVHPDLPAGNLKIKVQASSLSNNLVFDTKEFNLYVPVREIILAGDTTFEVEQRETYSFAGVIHPFTATSQEDLEYSIDVDGSIATITQAGLLTISATAPIGTPITITIKGPDLVTATHTVTVKTVYASAIEVTNVFGEVRPGQVLTFTAIFPAPYNVTESQKDFYLTLQSGHTEFATVNGETITIHNANTAINNPTFVVRVSSNQDGTIIYDDVIINVYIPVTSITLIQKTTQVNESNTSGLLGSYSIVGDLITSIVIHPANSNVRNITSYSIVGGSGANFVEIINDQTLNIKNGITAGNFTFILRVTSEGAYEDLHFTIYIAAINITLTAITPYESDGIQYALCGGTVKLLAGVDTKATAGAPQISIISGAEFVQNISSDGTLTVKNGIAAGNAIVLEATRDGIKSTPVTIVIYVPVDNLVITSEQAFQRGSNQMRVTLDGGSAAGINWEVTRITVGSTDIAASSFDINSGILTIPQNTRGGTITTVSYRVIELGGIPSETFHATFTVSALSTSLYNQIWSADNLGVELTNSRLHVGRWSTFSLNWNGVTNLSQYGVVWSASVISGTTSALSGTTLTMPSTASGSSFITIRIYIFDDVNASVASYTIDKTIYAFRPMSGSVYITNPTISAKSTQLYFAGLGWDNSATYGISNLKFIAESGSYVSISNTGIFTVNSASTPASQSVKLEYYQPYNDSTIYFYTSASLTVKWMTLNKNGGSGGLDSVLAVDTFGSNLSSVPTREGYNFNGYYGSWSGVQYYNSSGTFMSRTFSSYPNDTYLYASWSGKTYTAKLAVSGDHNLTNDTVKGVTRTFGTTYAFTMEMSNSKCKITGATHNGNQTTGSVWIVSGYNTSFATFYYSNLSTSGGEITITIKFGCSHSCVTEDTLITLEDGSQKQVQHLDGTERLLVWNFYTGTYDSAYIVFIESSERQEFEVIHLFFSDGTDVKVIGHHGYWSFDLNRYVTFKADNATEFIGQWFKKQTASLNGYEKVQLVDVQIYTEYTSAWSPVTVGHLNFYTNGMLSMPGAVTPFMNIFNVDANTMTWNEEQMQTDIEMYGLFTCEDLAHLVPEIVFDALSLKYLKVAVGKGMMTWEEMEELADRFYKYFQALLEPGGSD